MSNQFLKLRRSAIPGRIPTTSSLDFGEVALNTYDGLAFMKKSGSNGEEVVPIGIISGSFTGSFYGTASYAETASYLDRDIARIVKNDLTASVEDGEFNIYYNTSSVFTIGQDSLILRTANSTKTLLEVGNSYFNITAGDDTLDNITTYEFDNGDITVHNNEGNFVYELSTLGYIRLYNPNLYPSSSNYIMWKTEPDGGYTHFLPNSNGTYTLSVNNVTSSRNGNVILNSVPTSSYLDGDVSRIASGYVTASVDSIDIFKVEVEQNKVLSFENTNTLTGTQFKLYDVVSGSTGTSVLDSLIKEPNSFYVNFNLAQPINEEYGNYNFLSGQLDYFTLYNFFESDGYINNYQGLYKDNSIFYISLLDNVSPFIHILSTTGSFKVNTSYETTTVNSLDVNSNYIKLNYNLEGTEGNALFAQPSWFLIYNTVSSSLGYNSIGSLGISKDGFFKYITVTSGSDNTILGTYDQFNVINNTLTLRSTNFTENTVYGYNTVYDYDSLVKDDNEFKLYLTTLDTGSNTYNSNQLLQLDKDNFTVYRVYDNGNSNDFSIRKTIDRFEVRNYTTQSNGSSFSDNVVEVTNNYFVTRGFVKESNNNWSAYDTLTNDNDRLNKYIILQNDNGGWSSNAALEVGYNYFYYYSQKKINGSWTNFANLSFTPENGLYTIGDVDNAYSGSYFQIDDFNNRFSFVDGHISASAITSSLYGTASYADRALTASYVSGGSTINSGDPSSYIGLIPITGSASTYMRSDAAPAISQSITPIWTGLHTFQKSSINTTATEVVRLENISSAVSGNPQYSPFLSFTGRWFNTGNNTSNTSIVRIFDRTYSTSNTNTPAELVFQTAFDGTTFKDALTLSAGNLNPILKIHNNGEIQVNNINVNSGTIITIGNPIYVTNSATNGMIGALYIGGNPGNIATSALFHVNSTSKGSIAFPKMTTAQRTAISSPTSGLGVYDTNLNTLYIYNGTAWVMMPNEGSSPTWSGTHIFTGNTTYNGNLFVSNSGGGAPQNVIGLLAGSSYATVQGYTNGGLSSTVGLRFYYNGLEQSSNGLFSHPGHNNFGYKFTGNRTASGTGGGTYADVRIEPTLNFVANTTNNGVYYGVLFNPTLTNTTNTRLYGFFNTVGNNALNTTSGNTIIGASTSSITSAKLEVISTTQGFLPPRMTKTQRNAIVSPEGGLLVVVTGETGGEYLSIYNANQTRWEKVNTTAD